MSILYIMCGVGFSGKSTLAKKISEIKHAELVSQDGMFFENEKELNLDLNDGAQWRMLLDMCKKKIYENLEAGKSVVFDNTNTRFEHREELREFVKPLVVKTKVVFLDTPLEVQKERQRNNLVTKERHDVKQEYLDEARKELEVPGENENTVIYKPGENMDNFVRSL